MKKKEDEPSFSFPGHVKPLREEESFSREVITYLQSVKNVRESFYEVDSLEESLKSATQRRRAMQYKFFIDPTYYPEWLKDSTSKVFFDIEAISYEERIDGRVQGFGLAVSVDQDGNVEYWKQDEASELLEYLLTFDEIVTYHGFTYDNAVLAIEIDDDERIQQLYNKSFDLVPLVSLFGLVGKVGLDDLGQYLVGEKKKKLGFSSAGVPGILKKGTQEEVEKVWEYCLQDVVLTMKIYQLYGVSIHQKMLALDLKLSESYRILFDIISKEITQMLYSDLSIDMFLLNSIEKFEHRVDLLSGLIKNGNQEDQEFHGSLLYFLEKIREVPEEYRDESMEKLWNYLNGHRLYKLNGSSTRGSRRRYADTIDWKLLKIERPDF